MRLLFLVAVLAMCAASCTINKDIMFQTDKEFVFDQLDTSMTDTSYVLAPNDQVTIQVYSNNGARINELTTLQGNNSNPGAVVLIPYTVEEDGTVDMPEIGKIYLQGLTLFEAEEEVARRMSEFYIDPYIIVRVTNRRCIVYPGGGGDAQVVDIGNNNTNIVEALALAGGINARGNAEEIKLFRFNRDTQDYDIYHLDLSTIDGIHLATMPVQANDIIYVQPVPQLASEILSDIAPIVSILSTLAFVLALFRAQT